MVPPIEVRVGVRVRVRIEVCNVNDPGIELGGGVCDFQKVLPEQLCPRAKRDEQVYTANSADPCSYANVSRLCIDAMGYMCFAIGSSTWVSGRQQFTTLNLSMDQIQWRVLNHVISGTMG